MDPTVSVGLAGAVFVGTHVLSSNVLRRPLVARYGEQGFLGIHSLLATVTLGWLSWAYYVAPLGEPLWAVGEGTWATVTVVMLLASILLAGSLFGNPAMVPMSDARPAPPEARGVYAVTRHPMMWSIAIWGLCHIAVFPDPPQIALAAAVTILAIAGSAFQDGKRRRVRPETWPDWQARTSFVPFVAVLTGRARLGGVGWWVIAGAVVYWFGVTWLHVPLSGWPAGIWFWL